MSTSQNLNFTGHLFELTHSVHKFIKKETTWMT